MLSKKIRNGNSSGKISKSGVSFDNNDLNLEYEESAEDIDYLDSSSDYEDTENKGTNGTPKSPHQRRGYLGHRWKKNEDDELELCETWIKETYIHK